MPWYKLFSRVGKTCLIANTHNVCDVHSSFNSVLSSSLNQIQHKQNNTQENSNQNQSINLHDDVNTPVLMPLNFYKFESTHTITEFINNLNANKNSLNGISCNFHESQDSFLSDLVCFNKNK